MVRVAVLLFRFLIWPALCLTLQAAPSLADNIAILPKPKSEQDVRYRYDRELLDLALKASSDFFGRYEIRTAKLVMTTKRTQREILSGMRINIMRSPTSDHLERNALPIRIPIMKGLLGYRVLMIRAEDQPKYDTVQTAADLTQYTLGQGNGWNDIPILEANGLKVERAPTYDSLFGMLAQSRFDFFPRGVNEILPELESRRARYPNLAADRALLLHYPFPVYFFVAGSAPDLAARVELGLRRLKEDGRLEKLLLKHFGQHIEELNLTGRRLIELRNPYLPEKTPLDETGLWYNPFG
ncbi:substrate-binding periplasmic protein [Aestuariispira insulae]|uniref:Amino acid ABC transporter substrate-binding protein (PAAT family) n=1 Tax=Aestuariispira insulae TaxID=1461337 RepID=A0A3D9HSP7_9PROT|nr:transporter substrate-binding domain-containing protein [Aestuariispira insulae]RED52532.1 amino acid ABC transporter substrate-binding protein (PAAT family) [Aestuariispira insulae]